MAENNTQVLIDRLPEDRLQASDYRLASAPMPAPGAGEVLVETEAFAITAGTRAGLQGSACYAGAPKTGVVMNGTGFGTVVASKHAAVPLGTRVLGPVGWQTHAVLSGAAVTPIPTADDPLHWLGPLGINGLTAYFGLLRVGRPIVGETVLVSAAAGSVGHMVGQIAKLSDCRVVGVCGSDAKCARLESIGFDAAVNYREDGFRQALKAACPDGVDVYFDNTGGDVLGAALSRMNVAGRIACCGVVSQYDTSNPAPGPRGVPGLLVNKRLTMQGFLLFDFEAEYDAARDVIRGWLAAGRLAAIVDEVQGLDAAPAAFVDLLAGGNIGTRVVRVR